MLFFFRSQSVYDITQTTQTFVNILGLLELHSHAASFGHLFWASQVNEIQFALLGGVFLDIFLVDVDDEQGVTSGATLIHASEGHLSIGSPVVHCFQHLLSWSHIDFGAVLDEDSLVLVLLDLKSGLGCYIFRNYTYDLANRRAFRCKFRRKNT